MTDEEAIETYHRLTKEGKLVLIEKNEKIITDGVTVTREPRPRHIPPHDFNGTVHILSEDWIDEVSAISPEEWNEL